MYAALMHLSLDPELAPKAAAAFSDELLPRVKKADGFVKGSWVDPQDGKGFGFVVFESEEQAKAATEPSLWAAPGVVVDRVEIRRVAAEA